MKQSSPGSSESSPKVVAVLPCFNTERFITDVVSRAKKHVNRVIVIDDGSQDNTAEAAKAAGASVVSHGQNRGYGEALKSCFEAARTNSADVLVILDGDGQHNPDEIPALLSPIFKGEADLVIGSRFLSHEINIPRYREFGIGVITFLFNFGSRTRVSDSQSGFRSYHRRLFADLFPRERGMSISIEILEKARKRRFVIKEVPISCQYTSATLNLKAIGHGLGVALAVIKIRLRSWWGK